MTDQDKSHYVCLPVEEAESAPDGFVQHFKGYWWAMTDEGLLFYIRGRDRYPQCNQNEAISRKLAPSWARVQYLPSVLVRISFDGEYLIHETEVTPS